MSTAYVDDLAPKSAPGVECFIWLKFWLKSKRTKGKVNLLSLVNNSTPPLVISSHHRGSRYWYYTADMRYIPQTNFGINRSGAQWFHYWSGGLYHHRRITLDAPFYFTGALLYFYGDLISGRIMNYLCSIYFIVVSDIAFHQTHHRGSTLSSPRWKLREIHHCDWRSKRHPSRGMLVKILKTTTCLKYANV